MSKRNTFAQRRHKNVILLIIFNIGLNLGFSVGAMRQDVQLIKFAMKIYDIAISSTKLRTLHSLRICFPRLGAERSDVVKIMSERKVIEYQEIGQIYGRLETMSIIYDG